MVGMNLGRDDPAAGARVSRQLAGGGRRAFGEDLGTGLFEQF